MKRILCLVVALLLTISLIGCTPSRYQNDYYNESNIERLFKPKYIIGKTPSQIERKYGEFNYKKIDESGNGFAVYYVNWDRFTIMGLGPSNLHDDYTIKFSNGIAVSSKFQDGKAGG